MKGLAAGLLLLFATALVSANSESEASSLEQLDKRYTEAELVAQVQISGIHRDLDNALSEPGMVAILGYIYSAVSQQVWKGQANNLLAFRLGLDACAEKLNLGDKYIIFARSDSRGRLQLHSCEAFVPETEFAPLLAHFKQVGQRG